MGKRQESASVKSPGWKGQRVMPGTWEQGLRLLLTHVHVRCGSCPWVELPELGQEEK